MLLAEPAGKEAAVARRDDSLILMHIIAILLAFAALADGLIGVSPQRRRLVLRVLNPAAAVAHAFVYGEAGDLRRLPFPTPFDGDGQEDALRLAVCFRALAWALGAVLAQFSLSSASSAQAHRSGRQRCQLKRHQPVIVPATVFDTS
jgi:hypothetical protein